MIRRSSTDNTIGDGTLAYLAYQIWLHNNSLTFKAEVMLVHYVLDKAHSLAEEYCRFNCVDTADQLAVAPSFLDSLAIPALIRRVIFIFWELPLPGFIKLNFDYSVRDIRGGAGYVIQSPDARLLATRGFPLVEPSILEAELRDA